MGLRQSFWRIRGYVRRKRLRLANTKRFRRQDMPLLFFGSTIGIVVGLYVTGTPLPLPIGPRKGLESVTVLHGSFPICDRGGHGNCVIDGDTFTLDGTKIRIANIDAPELHPPRCETEAILGLRAKRRLSELLNGTPIVLGRVDHDLDIYGRQLRTVSVGGRDVGEILVTEGLARYGFRHPWCD